MNMSVIDDYISNLDTSDRETIEHMYEIARAVAPDATEEFSYGMPALKYKGKSLLSIMANKDFLSLYPFSAVDKLNLDLSDFECTSGSIHFSSDKPIPDDLLGQIISARMRNIDKL
jgi:uncharacterized protein YdhG (YjbR/CyaY superfamily)